MVHKQAWVGGVWVEYFVGPNSMVLIKRVMTKGGQDVLPTGNLYQHLVKQESGDKSGEAK